MAARGARSRKVVEKQITKAETKKADERYTPISSQRASDLSRVMSPVSTWGRRPTMTSGESVWSGESGGSSGRLSAAGSKLSATLTSISLKEERFAGKGKETSAPRGRGGGVPIKVSEKNNRDNIRSVRRAQSSHGFRPSSRATTSHTESDVPVGTRSWAKTKTWYGGLTAPKPYRGFEHDDDMWMSDGNCLIFFAEETSDDDPKPMCRIHAHVLEQARSIFMINLLRYGEIVLDDEDEGPQPRSERSTLSNNSQVTWPLSEKLLGSLDEFLNDETLSFRNLRVPPSISEDEATLQGSSPTTTARPPMPGDITHEIWFRAPSHITRPDVQRRHHMATRNYLALLYGLPLVGNDYFEMLSDLQNVMDTYYELNEASERWDSAQVIMQYLCQRQLDDVRGNLSAALGLMAWAEQPSVQWEAGYLEGFVHASGMMSPKTVEMKEFKLLSQVSRHKLQNAYNALQLKLMEAEDRLKAFDFPELWYAEGVTSGTAAQRSFDEFREFLATFYVTVYGNWPPRDLDHTGRWLSKIVVDRLQTDLGALYDYIVDRDVEWDVSEERHTRKWEMVSRGTYRNNGNFKADMPGLSITNMLVGFDTSMRYDHIPFPFPLLPSTTYGVKEKPSKRSLFSKFGSKKNVPVAGPKEQYQMALAFTAATNINRLGVAFKENKVLDTFQHHEKSFPPSVLSPVDARLGRWILLYAVLQILSTLSVDVIGLKYSNKIRYFACPALTGLPPWQRSGNGTSPSLMASDGASSSNHIALMREPAQKLSYCWLAASRWARGPGGSGDLTPTPPAYEMQGNLLSPTGPDFVPLRSASATNLGTHNPSHNPSELDGRALARARSMRLGPMSPPLQQGTSNGQHVGGITGQTPPPAFSSIVRQPVNHFLSQSPPPSFSSLAQTSQSLPATSPPPNASSPPPAFSSLSLNKRPTPPPQTTTATQSTPILTSANIINPSSPSLISPSLNFSFTPSSPKPSTPTTTYSLVPHTSTTITASSGVTSPPRRYASPAPSMLPNMHGGQEALGRDGRDARGFPPHKMIRGIRGSERGDNGLAVQKDYEVMHGGLGMPMSGIGERPPGFM